MRRRRNIQTVSACVLLIGLIGSGCGKGQSTQGATTGVSTQSSSTGTSPTSSGSTSATTGPTTSPTAATGAAALYNEAQRELSAMKKTHYQHTTAVDEAIGKFDYDCSGFIDYALGRVLPNAAKALPTSTSHRALAGDIEQFLHKAQSQPQMGWQGLSRVDQLGPGDLVSWLATEDSTTGDTGHVMIVLSAPTLNTARKGEWLVKVADSTLSPHAHDSRHSGQTGLGTGTIGLAVDANNAPTAFYWQGGISPHFKTTEIALGRPS